MKRFYKISDIFGAIFCVWTLLIIGSAVFFTSCASFKHLTMVSDEEFPRAAKCGKCHVAIYSEWLQSDHAKAFTNPHYRESTDNYSFENCLGCHAPEPTVADSVPTARSSHREEGVTCVSCHLEEGKLSGPINPTGKVAPHPIGVNPEFYKNNGICGRCHQGELAELDSVKTDGVETCQQCHMSQVTRKVTQATGGVSTIIVAFEHEVQQKQHDFAIDTVESGRQLISIEAKRHDTKVILKIKNNLPHSLPAGDFGFRILMLEAFAIDSKDNSTIAGQRELIKELASGIAPRMTLDWELEIPSGIQMLQVRLKRLGYEDDDIIDLTDIEVPLQ